MNSSLSKIVVLFFFLLPPGANTQMNLDKLNSEIEILLIGTAHEYDTSIVQQFSRVVNAVKKFDPQIIAVEYLRPRDSLDIKNWISEKILSQTEKIKNRNPSYDASDKYQENLYRQLAKHPKDFKSRIFLIHCLRVKLDFGNMHYQAWLLNNDIQNGLLGNDDWRLMEKILCPRDSFFTWQKRKNSEFPLLVFPLAKELKMDRIYPMDPHSNDTAFSIAAQAFFESLQVLRKDTLNNEVKETISQLNAFDLYYRMAREKRNQMAAGGRLLEFVNTPLSDSISFHSDFKDARMHILPGFPRREVMQKLSIWRLRNMEMCERVIEAAQRTKSKRVVIFVGHGHRVEMSTYLKSRSFVKMLDIKDWL